MTNRSSLLLVTGLLFLSMPLQAQSGRYVIEQRFLQRFVWIMDEYVLRYEVVIERNEGNGYREYLREFTELPRFQVSLPLGNYRYRVIPFDFLDQPGDASEWVFVDVNSVPVIPVEVQTIGDDSYALIPQTNVQLVPGINEIVIKNPDELEIQEGVLIVEKPTPPGPEKQVDVYLETVWSPLLPLYGGIEQLFGTRLYLPGAGLRFGFIVTKPNLLKPGVELSASWYALNNGIDNNTIEIQAGIMNLNFLLQKRILNQKMAFVLRAGGGLAFQIGDMSDEQDSYLLDRMAPHVSLDVSFFWLVLEQLYIETSLNYTHFLIDNNASGYLRPWIGVGLLY
ncbi:MAG: hypothetical protein LBG91_05655 [Treponema sp.]|jgi:hypothetical protein|nr:hypothetical protein [Treponema sp.]